LLDFLVLTLQSAVEEQSKMDAIMAIDQNQRLYTAGVINSANSPQLSQLPTLFEICPGCRVDHSELAFFAFHNNIVISLAGVVAL